jgi:ADP-ribose pyrophosphatase
VVAIVAVTRDRELVLIEQYRPPVDAHVIELPAGLSGDIEGQESEAFVQAAKRELVEETGYASTDWATLGSGSVSAGLTDEQVEIFLARDAYKVGPGGGDESEDITVHLVPLRQATRWLQARRLGGTLIDHKVITGVLLASLDHESDQIKSLVKQA